MKPRYEVQTQIGGTWENTWSEDDAPLTFDNPVEAESAMFDFLNETQAAGLEVDPNDYRLALCKNPCLPE